MSKTRTTRKMWMMWKLRTTKTGSGNTAVQVVRREHQRTIIVRHIGTARSKDDLLKLQKQAEIYIRNKSGLNPLFPEFFGLTQQQSITEVAQVINRLDADKAFHMFAYTFLSFFHDRLGFAALKNYLLRDLAIIRIIEPCSKLHSLELLEKYFSLHYGRTTLHLKLPDILALKENIETITVAYAKKYLGFDFSIVFYDVTTLYIEGFTEDEDTIDKDGNVTAKGLRRDGFSKDLKFNQPQIVIGLIVTKEGFPIAYEVFEGNTFEGDTFIPAILSFKKKHAIQTFTVVADAAMISFDNVEKLGELQLSYIVGARITNLKRNQMKQISTELIGEITENKEMEKKDGASMRITTERGLLVCDFSFKRYMKDRREMEKQIIRAENLIKKNADSKRTKFLRLKKSKKKEKVYELNNELIERNRLMLGIKGYYTNLFEKDKNITTTDIINHYHSLWHVEKAFRIAKSDLEARPIFHQKKENIEAHIVIVFVSLCISKSIEMLTHFSIKKVKDMIWDVLDITFTDLPTGTNFIKRINTAGNPMVKLLDKLQKMGKIF